MQLQDAKRHFPSTIARTIEGGWPLPSWVAQTLRKLQVPSPEPPRSPQGSQEHSKSGQKISKSAKDHPNTIPRHPKAAPKSLKIKILFKNMSFNENKIKGMKKQCLLPQDRSQNSRIPPKDRPKTSPDHPKWPQEQPRSPRIAPRSR